MDRAQYYNSKEVSVKYHILYNEIILVSRKQRVKGETWGLFGHMYRAVVLSWFSRSRLSNT